MTKRGLAAILLTVLAVPIMAYASQNRGIEISPPFRNLVISGASETPFDVTLTNHSAVPQTLQITAVDFKALDESGGAAFVGTSAGSTDYALSNWMRLDQPKVTIGAGQSTKITGAILNRDDLSPGGHYGALLFNLDSDGQPGGNQVGLKQVASSLIFAIKTGGEKHSMKVVGIPDLAKSALSPPSKIRLRFQNTGNVHEIPRGIATISDPQGRIVSKGTINADSSIVLPGSYRQIAVPMQRVRVAGSIGNYKVLVQYRYDNSDNIATYSQNIYIYSLIAILQIIFWLAVLVVGLRAFWKLRKR